MGKALKFDEWLNESRKINEDSGVHEFGCAMVYYDMPKMTELHAKIDKEDIYEEEGDRSYGLETEPHTTLLYGIHDNEVSSDKVLEICGKYEYPELKLHNVSLFENDKYDVLKFDVDGEVLHEVNKDLMELPHTTSFPDYHPHSTIAYLKPGMGKKYVQQMKEEEVLVKPSKIVYSKPDGEKVIQAISTLK